MQGALSKGRISSDEMVLNLGIRNAHNSRIDRGCVESGQQPRSQRKLEAASLWLCTGECAVSRRKLAGWLQVEKQSPMHAALKRG